MDILQYLNEQCGLNKHRGQIDSNDGFKEEGLGVVNRFVEKKGETMQKRNWK